MTFDWPLEPDDSINGIIGAAMKLIMQCFYTPELATSTIHCLTGIAQQAPKYLTKAGSEALNELLTSQQAESYVEQLLGGKYESETTQFVVFVASLLELHDMSSPDAFQDQSLRIILIILRNLLYMPGTPVIVDSVSQVVLDAFNQIAEGWGDWVGTDAADESIKPLVHEACMRYAAKIQYPAEESDYASHLWESDERAKFQDFRHDFQDLLLASYACVGPELIDNLAAYLETSDISSGWENLEAQLYCLGAFSDVVSSNTAELGGHVLRVLTSQKWDFLVQNVNTIPERARQGAINFISRYTFILQQNQQLLLPCINFLFASLYLPGSTTSASRAIYTLCHRQRIMLVEALPQFIDSISILTNIQPEERHRLYGAVAAIIQAIPTEEGKAAPLIRILNLISQSTKVPEAPSANSDESGVLSAIDLVQTLAAVGKGLRAPADDAIDLDAEPGIEEQDFWTSGSGKQVQETVQNVLDHVLATYPEEPLLIEATCDLLKSGYTELHPSPFKFHASYSASFLSHVIQPQSSRVGLIMNTASSFLASHASSPDAIRNEFLQISAAVTWHQQALLQSFSVDKIYTDHEFTHSSLEYFSSILPKYDYYFGDKGLSDAWQILFEFALLALENPDTLPRRSSAQFWVRPLIHLFRLHAY